MRINSVTIHTHSVNDLHNFYSKIEGIDSIISDNGLMLKAGFSTIRFLEEKNTEDPYYHFAFNIAPKKFDEEFTKISTQFQLLENEGNIVHDFKSWKAKAFYFFDSAGNIVEFIARERLANVKSSGSILSLGEIALGSADLSSLKDTLIEFLKIDTFDKGHEEFCALGDDEGLLILSADSRNWFPTGIPVKTFPSEIEIELRSEKYLIIHNESELMIKRIIA